MTGDVGKTWHTARYHVVFRSSQARASEARASTPWPYGKNGGSFETLRAGDTARTSIPRRDANGDVRDGLLLGCREEILGAPGRVLDPCGIRGRFDAENDVPRSLLGADGAYRGRASRLRSVEGALRRTLAHVLGESRPNARDAAGQRCRHPVSIGYLPRQRSRHESGGGFA